MMKQGHVLVVDDLEQWREELVETLQRSGFHVDSASTATEALNQLDEMFYHLLVLDIRLDETDPSNIDGLDLLREIERRGMGDAVQVIMISAHDTKEQIRTAFREFHVADFLSKDKFNNREFLENVRQIFAKEVNINLALTIHWQQVNGPDDVVVNLEVGGSRLKRNSSLRSRIAVELEDLLCRLFYQAESLLVRPLTAGQSTTGVLWVQPFYSTGGGRAVVVKFGDFQIINEEYINFKTYVQPFIGGGRNTTVLDVRRTPRLGGIVYSLLGATNDYLEDFGSFYHHSEVSHVRDTLDQLFLDTCGAWYANVGQLRPYDLTADYQHLFEFTKEKIERALVELQKYVQIKSVQGRQMLEFKSLHSGQTFTNPLPLLNEPHLFQSTYVCTTHGDFNQHNIFVDSTEHTWLIDFQSTEQGHIFRDVAQLDSEVRFSLLQLEEATLEERLHMEEALCSVDRFSQIEHLASKFSTENASLAKAYATVTHLRTLASKLAPQRPSDDMNEYYIALFYNAINMLRMYSLPSRLREHAVLCASLLASRLGSRG